MQKPLAIGIDLGGTQLRAALVDCDGGIVSRAAVETDVAGRNVLIVDDILESGRTLAFAKDLIAARGAANVLTAVLLNKPGHLAVDLKADFQGFVCPDKFVVGYGMDMAHQFRELPFVGHVLSV